MKYRDDRISVDQIGDQSRDFEFRAHPRWWAEQGVDPRLIEALRDPVEFRVTASRLGTSLLLEGEMRGAMELACSRCLDRYRQPVLEPFRLILEPAGDRVPADPEGARQLAGEGLFLSDELELGWFQGNDVALGRFYAELVTLQFPVQPLCGEDCLGLCPRCGVNRNESPCDCRQDTAASPFAALAGLRERLAGSGRKEP